MSDLAKIPTEAFDASRHVIAGREQGTGKQVWFTLESVSEAERVYEGAPDRADVRDFVTKDELVLFRDVIVKAVSENIPPPQMAHEITAALVEASQAIATLRGRVQELEAASADMAHNFSVLRDKWGAM